MIKREIITSLKVRKSPWYAHAVRVENMVYTSGVTPVDPENGAIGGDIREQTFRVLTNLKNILEAASSSLESVVKVNTYLAEMDHFSEYNEVYGQFFREGNRPARTTIQVGKFKGGMLIEIDAISLVNDEGS